MKWWWSSFGIACLQTKKKDKIDIVKIVYVCVERVIVVITNRMTPYMYGKKYNISIEQQYA